MTMGSVMTTVSSNGFATAGDTEPPVRPPVRRSLFGIAEETDDDRMYLNRQLDAISEEQMRRWGFDFEAERPVDNDTYTWIPVRCRCKEAEQSAAKTRLRQTIIDEYMNPKKRSYDCTKIKIQLNESDTCQSSPVKQSTNCSSHSSDIPLPKRQCSS